MRTLMMCPCKLDFRTVSSIFAACVSELGVVHPGRQSSGLATSCAGRQQKGYSLGDATNPRSSVQALAGANKQLAGSTQAMHVLAFWLRWGLLLVAPLAASFRLSPRGDEDGAPCWVYSSREDALDQVGYTAEEPRRQDTTVDLGAAARSPYDPKVVL